MAFYIRICDIAADVMLDNFNMGGESAKKDKKTTFVAEMHTTYNQEVKLGEEVETHITFVLFLPLSIISVIFEFIAIILKRGGILRIVIQKI